MKKYTGTVLLIVAAFIWGTAFVAQADAAQSIPPFTFSALRSLVGAAVLLVFLTLRSRFSKQKQSKADLKTLLISGVICGFVLFVAMNLQQYGISVYPPQVNNIPGRSGFLTAMYVVLVPICGLFFKKKVPPVVWLAAVLAVVALWLLCLKNGFGGIYLGDVLMFICALAFTAHIITVDTLGVKTDGVMLSCVQFFVAGILSLVAGLIFEPKTPLQVITDAWLPILYVGVLSSGVAYTLQIIGQKNTEPAVASIVMSLESVFAVLGGWVIFGEWLSGREVLGCVVMFAAVLLAQSPQFLRKDKAR
ncbi:MAG: DMT family transporter [Ruminococcaceae bacterium]|nr:DMT family transporter [Oscillospiraceae bacterium]